MAEGDTILRAARELGAALVGQRLSVTAPHPRGRASGVERLDGRPLQGVEARGKHLLLDFGAAVLHSHLGMNGSWRVARRGSGFGKPDSAAWVVLAGEDHRAAQFGGPTLRLLPARAGAARPDALPPRPRRPRRRLRPGSRGPLAAGAAAGAGSLGAAVDGERVAAAVGGLTHQVVGGEGYPLELLVGERGDRAPGIEAGDEAGLALKDVADAGDQGLVEKRLAERPLSGHPIRSRGQGDANRTTYWCPVCQPAAGQGSSVRFFRPNG